MYYSAEINGFIPDAWKDDGTYPEGSWPEDAVLLTEDELVLFVGVSAPVGKILGSSAGRPVWVDVPPPSEAELIAMAETRRDELLRVAAIRIAPLQDAVDLDDATDAEVGLLKAWKQYRIKLNRLPDQSGYPSAIDWPAPPA